MIVDGFRRIRRSTFTEGAIIERAQYIRHSRARVAETAKDASRHATPCNAGRAGAHRPSEALHPTRSSDVLPRIERARVPTTPHVAKTRRNVRPILNATTPSLFQQKPENLAFRSMILNFSQKKLSNRSGEDYGSRKVNANPQLLLGAGRIPGRCSHSRQRTYPQRQPWD